MKAQLNIALVIVSVLALCPRATVAEDNGAAEPSPPRNPAVAVQKTPNATNDGTANADPRATPPAAQNAATATNAAAADADAQVNQPTAPAPIQKAATATRETLQKHHVGAYFGAALDPEMIEVGGHGSWRLFNALDLNPGLELGFGELSTLFGINVDFIYTFPGFTSAMTWVPYVGGGPNFALTHKSFKSEEDLGVTPTTTTTTVTTSAGTEVTSTSASRFDFTDTSWETGANFIVGARTRRNVFLEMRATLYGAQVVRVLAGFGF